jgi:hypothetical protein
MSGILRSKLGFEPLERKQMLAGDALVSVVNGNLLVEGDAEANSIVITAGEAEGTLVIQGFDGTNVQFADAEPTDPPTPETGLVVEGVTKHVRVNLGGGDDTLVIHDAEFRRSLTISTGAGEDDVRIGAAEDVEGELSEDAANVTVRGVLSIGAGEDNDEVVVGNAAAAAVSVFTDGGDDTVTLGLEDAASGASADGDDAATLRARFGVSVALGDGADVATLQDVSARGGVFVGGGDGADTVNLADVRAAVLAVRGGGDESTDMVSVESLEIAHAGLDLGDGADELSIVDSAFKSLAVGMGGGDDSLSMSAVTARRVLLAGGEGAGDELSDAGDNTIGRLTVVGFEIPTDVNTDPATARHGRHGRLPGLIGGLLGRLRR